ERAVPREGHRQLERQRELPERAGADGETERERQQLGRHAPDQRHLDLAHRLLRSELMTMNLAKLTVAALLAASTGLAVVTLEAPAQAATCNGYVGLTFDDGPSNDHTPAILNALKANGLRATMFNEGQFAAQFPAQVQAEVNAGMWVGNHSYTHPHLIQQSQAQIDSEVSRTQQAIANAGGGTPKLFRPPYGETNSTLQAVEAKYGLTQIIWDVDSQDWN